MSVKIESHLYAHPLEEANENRYFVMCPDCDTEYVRLFRSREKAERSARKHLLICKPRGIHLMVAGSREQLYIPIPGTKLQRKPTSVE